MLFLILFFKTIYNEVSMFVLRHIRIIAHEKPRVLRGFCMAGHIARDRTWQRFMMRRR